MHHPTPAAPPAAPVDPRVAAYWPQDRAERARLWDALMAAGVAEFWRRHDAQVAQRGAR